MLTLKEYNDRILEPAIKKLEKDLGKTSAEIIADCERRLEPVRKLRAQIRDRILNDD